MKTIIYKFADGTVSTVEVNDEIFAAHEELETYERRNHWRETRRHYSLDYLNSKGIDFACGSGDLLSGLIKQESEQEFERFLQATLRPKQVELFKQRVICGMTEAEIAKIEGVSQPAISQRLKTIFKKLKINF